MVTMHKLMLKGGLTIMMFAPKSVVQINSKQWCSSPGAISSDFGLEWSKDGVARLFDSQHADALVELLQSALLISIGHCREVMSLPYLVEQSLHKIWYLVFDYI